MNKAHSSGQVRRVGIWWSAVGYRPGRTLCHSAVGNRCLDTRCGFVVVHGVQLTTAVCSSVRSMHTATILGMTQHAGVCDAQVQARPLTPPTISSLGSECHFAWSAYSTQQVSLSCHLSCSHWGNETCSPEGRYRKPDGNGNVELQWSLIGNATESLAAAVTAAAAADLTVLAVGGSDQTTNEGCDRAELDLTGRQLELVQKVHAVAKKLVVVLIGEPAPQHSNRRSDKPPALWRSSLLQPITLIHCVKSSQRLFLRLEFSYLSSQTVWCLFGRWAADC